MATFHAPPTGPISTASRDLGKSHTQSGWRVSTHKYPICNATEINAMTEALGIAPPEMIFGNNAVRITHVASGFTVAFTAQDALDVVDKTGATMLKVAYSEEWQKMREKLSEEIKEVIRPFDWSYSSSWKGRVDGGGAAQLVAVGEDQGIPYEKLRRPDPILLFDEVVLYEDELADNGIAVMSVKVRVMPERLLVLQRFFLRLDGVVVRIRDTRVYVEFATGEVIREYVSKEAKYQDVKKVRLDPRRPPNFRPHRGTDRDQKFAMYPPDDIPSLLRDPNQLVDVLPIIETTRERTVVK